MLSGRAELDKFHYSMIIQWSDEDNKYIVTIPEFIGCTTHGNTYEEAVKNGQEAIKVCIEAEEVLGRSLPRPHVYAA
jgi:predicted RNase H-like HicB family nuclease